jgi:hypothetical protein
VRRRARLSTISRLFPRDLPPRSRAVDAANPQSPLVLNDSRLHRTWLAVAALVVDDHASVLIDGEFARADLDIVPASVLLFDKPTPTSHVAAGKLDEVDFDDLAAIEDCRFDYAGSSVVALL